MKIFKPKKAATEVKHLILADYLKAWGGIIINSNASIRLCFVDTCCGSGLYAPNPLSENLLANNGQFGSAVIGIQKLQELEEHARSRGKQIQTKALLINNSGAELETLEDVIRQQIPDPPTYELIEGRFEENGSRVLSFCENWFSFVFIDPYGPTPTPFSLTSRIVAHKFTDTLIYFPALSFDRWSGFLNSANISPRFEKRLKVIDDFMGTSSWRMLAAQAHKEGESVSDTLVDYFIKQLSEIGVGVFQIPLLFEDRDRTIYHLIFCSRNTAGLAEAKEIFQKAERHLAYLREYRTIRKEELRTGQNAFKFMKPQVPGPEKARDAINLSKLLFDTFANSEVTIEQVVLRGIRESYYLQADVFKALTLLKRSGKAKYDSKRYKDKVLFSI